MGHEMSLSGIKQVCDGRQAGGGSDLVGSLRINGKSLLCGGLRHNVKCSTSLLSSRSPPPAPPAQ